jgi:hypothetical protein
MTHTRRHILAAASGLLAAPVALAQATPSAPLLVELFTSQGCGACPGANTRVAAAAGPDTLVLSFSVDYWDYLGWRDTFADPANTARQRAYAEALGLRGPFTPQVVIDGRLQCAASRAQEFARTLTRARAGTRAVLLTPLAAPDGSVRVSLPSGLPADAVVSCACFAPGLTAVAPHAGQNRGRAMQVHNVVRRLTPLTPERGVVVPPAREPGLSQAVIVSAHAGGPVLALGALAA